STRPPGISAFCDWSARETSVTVTLWPCSRAGSSEMLIWRWRSPTTTTWPTPLTLSSWRRSVLSAYSVMSRIGLSAETASVITGAESGSNFSTVGCWMFLGSSGRTRLTRSRTSCAAMSPSFSSRKAMMTVETPSDEVERSSSMPLMVLTASSILSEISVSTSSGAAPGRRVVTTTVGKSTLGKRSSPSRVNENAPMTVSARMRTLAKTGRLTEIAANHCMTTSTFDLDAYAVRQLSARIGRDPLARLDAAGELDAVADLFPERHDPLFHLVAAADHVDAAGSRHRLDRLGRHEQRRHRRRLLQQRRREQPGLQPPVGVRRHRLDRQRPLIRLERRRDEAHLRGEHLVRICIHREAHPLAVAYLRQVLLRHRQLDADGIDADHRGHLHAARDVVARAHEALGDDAGKGGADDGVGRRLAGEIDARARRLQRSKRLLRRVLRHLVLLPRGLHLRQLLVVLG